MARDVHLRKRRRLKRKEIAAHATSLDREAGVRLFREADTVDEADAPGGAVVLLGGEIVAIALEGRTFPTVRGLLRARPDRRYVTVDMGAVPHVCNGADVMAPGVVDADPSVRPGDLVWVRDERNGQPLAIGEALLAGPGMVAGRRGKAVRTIHHVGDALWKAGEGPG